MGQYCYLKTGAHISRAKWTRFAMEVQEVLPAIADLEISLERVRYPGLHISRLPLGGFCSWPLPIRLYPKHKPVAAIICVLAHRAFGWPLLGLSLSAAEKDAVKQIAPSIEIDDYPYEQEHKCVKRERRSNAGWRHSVRCRRSVRGCAK